LFNEVPFGAALKFELSSDYTFITDQHTSWKSSNCLNFNILQQDFVNLSRQEVLLVVTKKNILGAGKTHM
jgi:hypothetical protein